MTKQWYKAVVKSKAETLRSYVICANAQLNPKGSVPRKPPSMLVALKPPGGNGLPKYVLRSVPNPSINSAVGMSIPNKSVNKAVEN